MSKNYINDSQMSEIVKYISDTMKFPIMGAGGGFAPIGTINFFDASIAPQGWLACDGQTYNITDYPELATYYASVHGSANFYGGNGTTTFAVPDLRGEFLRGTGTNSHTNQGSGANVGVHQDGTEHHDSILNYATDSNKCWLVSGYDINKPDYTGGNRKQFYSTNRDYSATPSRDAYVEASGTEGGSFPNKFTSRPTNTSFLICVKATVAGDPNGHVYSTEEQVVGTWVDGRPVYEKTINCGALPNNTTKTVSMGLENASKVISVDGYSYRNRQSDGETILPLPYVSGTASECVRIMPLITSDKLEIQSFMDRTNCTETYITIRYTKTTD